MPVQPYKIIVFSVTGFLAIYLGVVLWRGSPGTTPKPEGSLFINGVSFVAPSRPIEGGVFDSLRRIHANWIAVMPFAFSPGNSPEIMYGSKRQMWGERKEGLASTIQLAHERGIKVMLKPHIWVRGQGWAGDFKLDSEEDWKQWEQSYLGYIIPLAKLADSLHVEMFCVGLELKNVVNMRPECWGMFIQSVRKVYHGKLTYAANWDNFENFPAWAQLDYIGINAYFPLSAKPNPTTEDIRKGWKAYRQKIEAISDRYRKPVIFTEFGYRSVDGAAAKPWESPDFHEEKASPNYAIQQNAYEALFETFWKEPWFRGGFLWKWYDGRHRVLSRENTDYTPQGKPAEKTIARWYGE